MKLSLRSDAAVETVARFDDMCMVVRVYADGKVGITWYGLKYDFDSVDEAHAWFLKHDKNSPWEVEA